MWSAVPDQYGNVRVDKGSAVRLPCHVTPTTATNVTWLYTQKATSYLHYIYINDQLHERLRDLARIHNAADGDYSFILLHILPINEGRYRCFNQQQLLQNYVIYVTG